ncbi:hypothetical protein HK405_008286 [Cladochytrium tenue]|nr:hypothetical protein HK405_008286 [Cladochytrium tenue]
MPYIGAKPYRGREEVLQCDSSDGGKKVRDEVGLARGRGVADAPINVSGGAWSKPAPSRDHRVPAENDDDDDVVVVAAALIVLAVITGMPYRPAPPTSESPSSSIGTAFGIPIAKTRAFNYKRVEVLGNPTRIVNQKYERKELLCIQFRLIAASRAAIVGATQSEREYKHPHDPGCAQFDRVLEHSLIAFSVWHSGLLPAPQEQFEKPGFIGQ